MSSLKLVLYYNHANMTNSFKEYQKLLAQFVAFQSVSTDPKYLPEIDSTVLWLESLLFKKSFKVEVWKSKNANPVVFAQKSIDPSLPTILIYGHYDVQPAKKSDGWKGEPFTLSQTKTKLIGRGVVDNKGQILAHIVTVFDLLKSGGLRYNVKFLIEGNEETGNPDLATHLKKYKKKLACDILLVSDGELTNNKPTIEVSLRGGFNCTLTYKTGKNNLHSGLAGGAVPNAAYELSKFLASLYNKENSVSFKDFYKDLNPLSPEQLANNKSLVRGSVNIPNLMGVKSLLTEKGYDFFTQTGLRPTIQITGLKSGYIESGYANIVPAAAEARINFRLAPSQKADQIVKEFLKFVKANTPSYVDYKLSFGGLHDPVEVNTKNSYLKEVEKTLTNVYKTKVARRNVGGAIPFVGDVKEILGVDTLLVPLVNEDCNMHGANENFDINLALKALEFSRAFLGSVK
jgi:acetylornithine deacetylase/succinyl-diaminopimelate desuccinylase-like protein